LAAEEWMAASIELQVLNFLKNAGLLMDVRQAMQKSPARMICLVSMSYILLGV